MSAGAEVSMICRFCRGSVGELVLDMGLQPACDHFPESTGPVDDPVHPVQLWFCTGCRLAQLVDDPTLPEETRAVEPRVLVRQAEEAVAAVAQAGVLPLGGTVVEYGSPHGGSWLDILDGRGVTSRAAGGPPADVVLDCFGLMHDADLQAALEQRVADLAEDGVFLVQFHTLAAMLANGQWNAVRHGHPVYLSTPAVIGMLATVGLTTVRAWRFDLYGGTVLLAARRSGTSDESVARLVASETAAGVGDPEVLRGLQAASAGTAASLRAWLTEAKEQGRTVLGYGAASRAVPLLNRARIGPDLLPVVADASEAKHGRRMPGVGIPIVAPSELEARTPDQVILFVPDLLDEVRTHLPGIEAAGGQWVLAEPEPRAVAPLAAGPVTVDGARARADEIRDGDLGRMLADLADDFRSMSGRQLLVTGGAGFLGYYLVQLPLAWNDAHPAEPPIAVTVFDNYFRGVPDWLGELESRTDLELRSHDMRLPLPADMGDFAYIVHAAGIASPTYYRAHPIETMDANITGLRNLLDYASDRLVRGEELSGFLFFSSSEIYGDPSPESIPTPETYRGLVSCTGPRACYDESKRYGETLCVNFATQHGVPVRMARPFNNYGPGMKITDGRVVADLCRDVLNGRDLVLRSNGGPTRTFCYVSDAVTGYYLALLRGGAGEPFNIGIEQPEISMTELAESTVRTAKELFGSDLCVRHLPSPEDDYLVDNPNRRCPDISKARTELGYRPRVDLDEGLRRTLQWYAGHPGGSER